MTSALQSTARSQTWIAVPTLEEFEAVAAEHGGGGANMVVIERTTEPPYPAITDATYQTMFAAPDGTRFLIINDKNFDSHYFVLEDKGRLVKPWHIVGALLLIALGVGAWWKLVKK